MKKIIRKNLGSDTLIIKLQAKKPQSFVIRIVDAVAKRLLSEKYIIPKKKIEKLFINLPNRDYVLSVSVNSVNGDTDFRADAYLKSDKFYRSATGNEPMSGFFKCAV